MMLLKKLKNIFAKKPIDIYGPAYPATDKQQEEIGRLMQRLRRRKKERSVIQADASGAERSIRASAEQNKKHRDVCCRFDVLEKTTDL